ncbi:DUF2291 family protein [Raoultella terrigena]|uniref:DUF2291 family protein n=1 Tax=Raoultella terrigena TaxID=577 RepID=UPI001F52278D|nr:DUF2291 family protein [Raoultella terrigena]MCI1031034.1 DUF2291 family protein [Raoultella terrigena]
MLLKQWGVALIGCATLLLTACTVVNLDENGKPILPADPNAQPGFDNLSPQQIAQQTWQTRVIDSANQHALDANALESELKTSSSTPRSVFVRLTQQVSAVDVSSDREQKLTFSLNGRPFAVQVGPIMRGNAIRDASGFKFEDFTNQVQFAQLSRAYNREAAKRLPKVDAGWKDKSVTVIFAVTLSHGKAQDAAALVLQQETP